MRFCKHCNCTEANACPGGCFWVLPDTCSACAVKLLAAEGLSASDIIAAQNDVRENLREAGYQADAWLGQQLIAVPWEIAAAFLNVLQGWKSLLDGRAIQVQTQNAAVARDIARATAMGLDVWDGLAAKGILPARSDADAVMAAAAAAAQVPPAPLVPPPPRLWRPGDPG